MAGPGAQVQFLRMRCRNAHERALRHRILRNACGKAARPAKRVDLDALS